MRVKVVKDLPSMYRMNKGETYKIKQTITESLVDFLDCNNKSTVNISKQFLRDLITEGFLEELKDPIEVTFWVNVYLHKDGKYEVGMPCDTKEIAKTQIVSSPAYVETKKCTIKIEQ